MIPMIPMLPPLATALALVTLAADRAEAPNAAASATRPESTAAGDCLPAAQLATEPSGVDLVRTRLRALHPQLAFEIGEHGLVGHGLVLSLQPLQQVVVELGVGSFSMNGGGSKAGGGVRYRLIPNALSPYLGLGLGVAWNGEGVRSTDLAGVGSATYDFHWMLQARASAGFEYLHRSGLTLRLALNADLPLRSDFQLLGSTTDAAATAVRRLYGPGVGASFAVGFRF